MSIQSEFDRLARLYLGAPEGATINVYTGKGELCSYGTCGDDPYVEITSTSFDEDGYVYAKHTFDSFSDMINSLDQVEGRNCHNGHPFEPGVDVDMVAEERIPNPLWCNVCGEKQ